MFNFFFVFRVMPHPESQKAQSSHRMLLHVRSVALLESTVTDKGRKTIKFTEDYGISSILSGGGGYAQSFSFWLHRVCLNSREPFKRN